MDPNTRNYTKAEVDKIVERIVKDEQENASDNYFYIYIVTGALCMFLGSAYSLVTNLPTTNTERYISCMVGSGLAIGTPIGLWFIFAAIYYGYIGCVECTVENVPVLKNLVARRLYNNGGSATESDMV